MWDFGIWDCQASRFARNRRRRPHPFFPAKTAAVRRMNSRSVGSERIARSTIANGGRTRRHFFPLAISRLRARFRIGKHVLFHAKARGREGRKQTLFRGKWLNTNRSFPAAHVPPLSGPLEGLLFARPVSQVVGGSGENIAKHTEFEVGDFT